LINVDHTASTLSETALALFRQDLYNEDKQSYAVTNFLFTALHGMQTRSSDENSVRLSVCPFVCQTRTL